jgi:3-phosphoglycerate kinase
MSDELLTIDDMDVDGRRVLLRADLNVPLTPVSAGVPVGVADDTRIRAALPTIEELCRVVPIRLGRCSRWPTVWADSRALRSGSRRV